MSSPFASMGQQLLDAGIEEADLQKQAEPAEMNELLEDFGDAGVWVSNWILMDVLSGCPAGAQQQH